MIVGSSTSCVQIRNLKSKKSFKSPYQPNTEFLDADNNTRAISFGKSVEYVYIEGR